MQTLTMKAKSSVVKGEVGNGIEQIKPSKKSASLHIVLAESKAAVIQSLVGELREDHHVITTCTSLEQLNRKFSERKPDLLIIGTLEESSCLEVHRQCAKKWQGLTIILLAPMLDVHEYFRNWAIAKGVYDVLSSYPEKLHILREKVQEIGAWAKLMEIAEDAPSKKTPEKSSKSPINFPYHTATPQSTSYEQVLTVFDRPVTSGIETKAETSLKPLAANQNLFTHKQVLVALQQITNCSMTYFGGMAIANYWKKSQAATVSEHPWLECWTIDHRGSIEYFSSEVPPDQITPEQFASLQLWVQRFLHECERIIVGYTQMLDRMDVSEQVKQIISFD